MTRHKRSLLAAVVVAIVLAAAAATALVVAPRYYGESAQERRAMAAIERFAGEKVDAEMRGRRPYLGGEVLRFTRTTQSGPVDYYVDAKTNRVMRMDDFNHPAYKRVIREAAASATATQYASTHFDGYGSAGLSMSQSELVTHGKNTEKYYAFTWTKKDPASGALLPVAVTVRINAESGAVLSYDSLDVAVTVDTTPAIDRAQSGQTALLAVGSSVPSARVSDATLAVATDPPDDPRGDQALVWQVVIEGSDDAGYASGAFVYVDARSGHVLKVDPFQ